MNNYAGDGSPAYTPTVVTNFDTTLKDNGGPTFTHALTSDSNALDAGSNPESLTYDQRGANFNRVENGTADIGAFELQVGAPTYNVTYDGNTSDGGSVPVDANNYLETATVTVLGNSGTLTKAGNTFAGWNTASNGSGTSYAAAATFAMPASNVTLFATWTANPTYNVTYDGNTSDGGSVPVDANNYLETATVTVLGNSGTLTKAGNTFAGWNTASNGSGTSYAAAATFAMPASNVTLFATWTANPTYNVTYDGNTSDGGSVPVDANNYLETATVTVLGNSGTLTKAGNTFAGWNTASNGSGTSYAAAATFAMPASNVTLYGQWTTLPTYAVTYDANSPTSGTAPVDQTKTQGIDLTLSANTGSLAKTGFTFEGWNTAADGSGTDYAEGATYSVDAVLALFAKWTALPTYAVTYDANSPTSGTAPVDQTKTQGIDLTLSANTGSLAKTGLTFAGWNTAADGSGTDYAEGATYSVNAALALFAKWTALPTYAVTYDANSPTSGTAPTDQTKTQGIDLTLSANTGSLAKTGLTFAGWNTAADGSGTDYAVGATYSTDAALALFAKWTALPTYAVTYDVNSPTSGAAPADQTKTQGIDLTLQTNSGTLAKTGFTFEGWNTAADGSGTDYAEGATYSVDAVLALFAKWTALPTYAVTYDANSPTSGTAPTDQTKTQGIDLTLSANTGSLAKTGFTFEGWNTAADGSGTDYAEGATYSVDAALALFAKWTVSSYTLTYTAGANGSITGTSPQTVTYGNNGSQVTAVPNSDYYFVSWSDDVKGASRTDINVTADITVSAIFAIATKVTSGTKLEVSTNDISGMDKEFFRRPVVYGLFNDPVKGKIKKANAKVLNKITSKTASDYIKYQWIRSIVLYNKKLLLKANRAGITTAKWLLDNPISMIDSKMYVKAVTKAKTKVETYFATIQIAPPEISSIECWDGSDASSGVHKGSVIILKGKYFGKKMPRVSLEYTDLKGKLKQKRLKVQQVYKYKDSKGKVKSCMDLDTGDSEIRVKLPIKNWKTGNYYLVLNNKVGIALDTNSGTLPLIHFINETINNTPIANNDTVILYTGDSNYQIDVLDNDTDTEGDEIILTLPTQTTSKNAKFSVRKGKIIYMPPKGIEAPFSDSFVYKINDGHLGIAEGKVDVTINEALITGVESWSGATITTVHENSLIVIKGTDFGIKAPKVSIKYFDDGIPKSQSLKVIPSALYENSKNKARSS